MACSAYLMAQLISGKAYSCGRIFTLPLSVLCGLLMPATIMLAKAPCWYCLPVIAAVPLVAHVPLPSDWLLRKHIIVLSHADTNYCFISYFDYADTTPVKLV